MIQHSPAEYYLKYLVVHPDGYDNDQVIEICRRLGIDYLGLWYLDRLRDICVPPHPFYPTDREHTSSYGFIVNEMIRRAFLPDDAFRIAHSVLDYPRVRELVEVMMMSGAPLSSISYGVYRHRGFQLSEDALGAYRHYFFDIDMLDTTEMRALMLMRFRNILDEKNPEIRKQFTALDSVHRSDPRVVASRLPSSPLTAVMAQIQMGYMPKNMNLAEIVDATRTVATIRSLEAAINGGPMGAEMSSKFAITADVMNKMLETVIRPEDQLREELSRIAIRTSDRKVPVIGELTEGRHTVDMQPEPEKEEEDEPA